MITVHHLENSRSQRILWMLEELGLDYQVKRYNRNPETQLAPPELRQVHPLGKSPILEDGALKLAESGAIIEYLGSTYGDGALIPKEDEASYRQYVYWLHFAEGTLMSPLLFKLVFDRIKTSRMPFFAKPIANGIANKVLDGFVLPNVNRHMQYVNEFLSENEWFAGDRLSGADIQMSFPLEASIARGVGTEYASVYKFVKRVQKRPAYIDALAAGGPYAYI